jgi:hypothetical protein
MRGARSPGDGTGRVKTPAGNLGPGSTYKLTRRARRG